MTKFMQIVNCLIARALLLKKTATSVLHFETSMSNHSFVLFQKNLRLNLIFKLNSFEYAMVHYVSLCTTIPQPSMKRNSGHFVVTKEASRAVFVTPQELRHISLVNHLSSTTTAQAFSKRRGFSHNSLWWGRSLTTSTRRGR